MKKLIIFSSFLLKTAFAFALYGAGSNDTTEWTNTPSLSITGEAILYKPADQLQMNIGVVNVAETAEAALSENSSRMDAIIRNLQNSGLDPTEYETGRFSIHPKYSPYPKDPPPNWAPYIVGYEVSNILFIHTDKIEAAGRIIDAANKSGANNVDNISFTLHNPRQFWSDAVHDAAENAVMDAQVLADATGVRLGRILSLNLDNPNSSGNSNTMMYMAKSDSGSVTTPILPGNISIKARVSIVYEILPK